MLKKLAILMLLLALLGLAACSKPKKEAPEPEELDTQKPLTICFDLDNSPPRDPRHYDFDSGDMKYIGGRLRNKAANRFLKDLKAAGGPENVQLEFIEGNGSDRDGQLTRLRAELMAGEGPDLFVMRQSGRADLFLFPEKKMEDGMFLNLDKYMDTARFMEPEKMLAPVFDAGLSAEGSRFLLPMTYDLDAALMPSSYLELEPDAAPTLDDMLDLEGCFKDTLSLWKGAEDDPILIPHPALGVLADYKKESLSFTEEELSQFYQKLLDYEDRAGPGETANGILLYSLAAILSNEERALAREPVTLVPLYDKDGGITARVGVFAGVNANSKNPAGAFFAADFLLGHDYMRDSDIHMYMWNDTLPIYGDLLGPGQELPYTRTGGGGDLFLGLDGNYWEAFTGLTQRITQVQFPTRLDGEIDKGYLDYCRAADDQGRDKAVHEAYTTMRMLLGEA